MDKTQYQRIINEAVAKTINENVERAIVKAILGNVTPPKTRTQKAMRRDKQSEPTCP